MKVYLISNNLSENNICYSNRDNLEEKKMSRPLSLEGENASKMLALQEYLSDVNLIYSAMDAKSIGTAKYLADRLSKTIIISENLKDEVIGIIGNKSIRQVKFMQDHDFNIKLSEGESLNDVKYRMNHEISKLIHINMDHKLAIFTHKRAILGYLLTLGDIGYNLDDNLVIEYNEKVIYSGESKDVDIIELVIENGDVTDINIIDF